MFMAYKVQNACIALANVSFLHPMHHTLLFTVIVTLLLTVLCRLSGWAALQVIALVLAAAAELVTITLLLCFLLYSTHVC
jgi:hypothetical protein